ncbi:phenylalanine--tRNA ligase subunit beta [Patescibacteria group bacterium]|nr:phenylalanine--tRNA ligase subunit beta [Patescibacteria group bacterium]MBP9709748.1 phenylalanine--tRNA ligase subunit beta [Patescibacteria group bacterium]
MNILASYDWVKDYVTLTETPEQFAARVSLSGPGIERLYPQAPLYEGMVVGQIKDIETHPNADKLRLAKVDLGERVITVVCGGSNLERNQWIVAALPGAKVRWHGEGDLIELKPTEIRGVASEGMICAANEIGLFDAFPHGEREILDLGKAFKKEKKTVFKAGQSLAAFLGLEQDVIMDIEVTTNRPDAMGIVGLAREAAAILKQPFTWKAPKLKAGEQPLHVQVSKKDLCPRFMAVRIDGVKVGHSPWWLKRRLLSAGLRPINTVVDITNYILHELGRPMHVFDAQKIQGGLHVRSAKAGETLKALDGKTYELDAHHLVVADDVGPQSIAGIMGGEESGATSDTTSVIFECAVWDQTHIRKTARELNLSSASQSLFEKGLSTESCPIGLARAIELCLKLAGGKVTSVIADVQAEPYVSPIYSVTVKEVNELIGLELDKKAIQDTLKRLGFVVKTSRNTFEVTVPWWRDHDIESGRDLIEEVARVYGYVNIPAIYPPALTPKPRNNTLVQEQRVRELAKGAGYTEIFSYSFISRELAEKAGFDPSRMLRVQNPLSADFEFMRTTLFPSVLQTVAENQERFRSQHIFEVANVYYLRDGKTNDLPQEEGECVAAVLGKGEAFREAKGLAEHLLSEFGIDSIQWKPLTTDLFWHPGRTVQAFSGEHLLASVGEVHPSIANKFKIEDRVALLHIPLKELFVAAKHTKTYKPLPIFPEAKRDIAPVVPREVTVQAMEQAIRQSSSLITSVEWSETYQGQGIPEGKKSLTFYLTFSQPDRTLETSEVDTAMQALQQALTQQFQAEWRA